MSEELAASVARPARKQQQRSIVTQQKLLDAAIEAFSENGFKGTSTRDIAERAGVHHPLITYHFKNKDQLWRAAVDQIFTEFTGALTSALHESTQKNPKERFAAMIRAYLGHAKQQPALHKIIVQEANYPNARIDWLVEHHMQPAYEATVEPLKQLQAAGIAAPGNSAIIYHLIRLCAGGSLALGLVLKGTSGVDLECDDTLDELADIIIRVFLPGDVPGGQLNAD